MAIILGGREGDSPALLSGTEDSRCWGHCGAGPLHTAAHVIRYNTKVKNLYRKTPFFVYALGLQVYKLH